MFALCAAAFVLAPQDPPTIPLRKPETKTAERRRFHLPDVKPMPMRIRLDAWQKRQEMLAASPFQQLMWQSVGSEIQGGRVVDIEAPKSNPHELYIGYATGGLWRTTTEGEVMEPLFDFESSFGIGDFAVSDDGQTIWMGTGENNSQRTSYSGTGVFKSTDRGATWQNMGLHESHHIGRILIHPKDPDTVYVASLGPLYSQGGERGVFKTTNGGQSWTQILELDRYTGVIDLDMDPRNPDRMWAVAWDRDRRAWNMLESGPGSGIYATTDGGKNWSMIKSMPHGETMGRAALAIAPSRPDTMYVFFDAQTGDEKQDMRDERQPDGNLTLRRFRFLDDELLKQMDRTDLRVFLARYLPRGTNTSDVLEQIQEDKIGMADLETMMLQANPNVFNQQIRLGEVWRSDDGGKTWTDAAGRMGSHGGYYWNKITVDPTDHTKLYTTGLLLLKSTDSGETWTPIARRNHVDHHALWIDPTNTDRMVNGNDGGPYISYDGGDSWRHFNNIAVGQFTTLALDNKTPYNIYGGLQDNGTMKGPSNHVSGQSSINNWSAIGGGDGSMIQVDPRGDGRYVYIASQFGNFQFIDQETGQRRRVRPRGQGLRFNWLAPVLISPHHPDIVYIGSQKLHRSFDQGQSFTDLSDDLTKDLPNGDVPFSTLTQIAESPFQFGQIWIGADDGTIKYTPNSGFTWQDVSTPAKDRWVTRIIASKHEAGRVYVSQNGYRQDEWTAYVWRSDDYGKTWTSIVGNLPAEPVNTIREDPEDADMLYVGTDTGVYVTKDGGAKWWVLGGGLPTAPVHDVQIHERDREIVAATHSRSVWKLGLEPVQDLDEELMSTALKVLDLNAPTGAANWAYRRTADYSDGRLPEPMISFQFWSGSTGQATVEVVDSSGKIVKSMALAATPGYNFGQIGVQLKPAQKPGLNPPKKPTTPEEALADPNKALRAQYLPAGEYTLRITRGSEKAEEEFRLR